MRSLTHPREVTPVRTVFWEPRTILVKIPAGEVAICEHGNDYINVFGARCLRICPVHTLTLDERPADSNAGYQSRLVQRNIF